MRFRTYTNGLKTSCLEQYGNSGFEAADICNDRNVKQELDKCFAYECRDFERFGTPIILEHK
jgi:hypothetical protein